MEGLETGVYEALNPIAILQCDFNTYFVRLAYPVLAPARLAE